MTNPLNQFIIKPLVEINVFGKCVIFTNVTISFFTSYIIIISIIYIAFGNIKLLGTRNQVIGELIIMSVKKILISSAGKKSVFFLNFMLTTFLFILVSNISGMIPFNFTATSHICVTATISTLVFLKITAIGFAYNKIKYFKILMPQGTPLFLAPLIIVIEFFTYISKPVSLSVRLAANMTAGHVVLKVLASFMLTSGWILWIIPFILLIVITSFELIVCVMQAYIFTILTCTYLNNALNLH